MPRTPICFQKAHTPRRFWPFFGLFTRSRWAAFPNETGYQAACFPTVGSLCLDADLRPSFYFAIGKKLPLDIARRTSIAWPVSWYEEFTCICAWILRWICCRWNILSCFFFRLSTWIQCLTLSLSLSEEGETESKNIYKRFKSDKQQHRQQVKHRGILYPMSDL